MAFLLQESLPLDLSRRLSHHIPGILPVTLIKLISVLFVLLDSYKQGDQRACRA